eukprot:6208936-Pleurochrysis_carterae.AAC.3
MRSITSASSSSCTAVAARLRALGLLFSPSLGGIAGAHVEPHGAPPTPSPPAAVGTAGRPPSSRAWNSARAVTSRPCSSAPTTRTVCGASACSSQSARSTLSGLRTPSNFLSSGALSRIIPSSVSQRIGSRSIATQSTRNVSKARCSSVWATPAVGCSAGRGSPEQHILCDAFGMPGPTKAAAPIINGGAGRCTAICTGEEETGRMPGVGKLCCGSCGGCGVVCLVASGGPKPSCRSTRSRRPACSA